MPGTKRGALVALLLAACAGEPDDLADGAGADDPVLDVPGSPPQTAALATLAPRRQLARLAQNHMINYGSWSASELELAKTHDVVILDPVDGVTRAQVAAIQGGTNPADPAARVLVLCYISIGEDIRTVDVSAEEMRTDPRFIGDGTGPRMDPRGPYHDNEPLTGIDPLGLPSNGGTGYASWYLDDVSVRNGVGNVGDGVPDKNGNFDGAFVNAGDPRWFAALQDMRLDGVDRVAGLREMLTTTYGRGLGCDGVFLDTIDTAAPNSWTDADSSNETKYEWTAPGFALFLQRLRAAYPDVVILQNRGLFFFNPRNVQYQFIPRGLLDFVLYESYRLNSSSSSNPHPYHYPNNRFNFAPKLMAEANREDGFRVLSVGYAEGPVDQMNENTLVGGSTLGTASLLEDIRVTERLAGFRHYLTNSSLTLVNSFVEDRADRSDASPPVWTSTYNDRDSYPTPPGEATPRPGIQQVLAGQGTLTVRWDVDLNRVGYALYYKTTPFDFAADPNLTTATRVVLQGRPTTAYTGGVGPGVYSNEATITGLVAGQSYHCVIRAFDELGHEEKNQVVRSTAPAPETPYLGSFQVSNTETALRYRFEYAETWTWRRAYIDVDRMTGTGWSAYGIGADYLLEEGSLYRYTGSGSNWAWSRVKGVTRTSGPINGRTFVQWDLARSDLGSTTHTRIVFQIQRTGGVNTTSAPQDHLYTGGTAPTPISGYFVSNDATLVRFHADVNQPFTYKHIFIDPDANALTGYAFGGIGASYMIENGSLYRHTGGGWSWTRVGGANMVVSGAGHDWSVARADLGLATGSPLIKVVFQANGGSPTYVAPVYTHAFSR